MIACKAVQIETAMKELCKFICACADLHEALNQHHGDQRSVQPARICRDISHGLQDTQTLVQHALGVSHIVTDGGRQPRHVGLQQCTCHALGKSISVLHETTHIVGFCVFQSQGRSDTWQMCKRIAASHVWILPLCGEPQEGASCPVTHCAGLQGLVCTAG